MSSSKRSAVYPQIRDEAVQWFVAFCEEEVHPHTCREFNSWLRKSPEHVRAYLRVSAFWEDAEDLKNHIRHGTDELVRRARAESNVVALEEGPECRAWPAPRRLRTKRFALAASLAALCVSAGLSLWLYLDRMPIYATAIGEQRTLTLKDGSTVALNAHSRIQVRYSRTQREVDLIEGQALFKVAKNPSRPFIVHSDGTNVRAVGTQFDVYRKGNSTVVTVVEGRVAVFDTQDIEVQPALNRSTGPSTTTALTAPKSHKPTSVFAAAGERVVATGQVVEVPQPVNLASATAWTEGKLVFDSASLKEVLEEFNQYLPRPLVADDEQLLGMRISGVFAVTDAPQFVEFLHQRFGTASHETEDEIKITRQ